MCVSLKYIRGAYVRIGNTSDILVRQLYFYVDVHTGCYEKLRM